MTTAISASAAMGKGWELFKANWKIALQLFGVLMVLSIGTSFIQGMLGEESMAAGLVSIASSLASMYLGYGMIKGLLMIHDGQTPTMSVFSQPIAPVAKYILGALAAGLVIGIGFLFFIIPGIYLALKYAFVPYILVDKEVGIGEAFSMSGKMTEGHKMDLFLFWLLSIGVSILGMLALIVGIIPAALTIYFGYIVLYREWAKASGV